MAARREWSIGVAVAGVLVSRPLLAQTMEIRLRDEASQAPIVGAIVRLLGDRGPVAQGLSNESGRVVLRAPVAGSYRLKVDRIGWAGALAGPYALEEGQTLRREVLLASTRLELPALTVEGASRCERTSRGGALAVALWEEVRKALTASIISGEGPPAATHVREFNRDLDLSGRPLREHLVLSRILLGQRYRALAPGLLASGGFVFPKGDRMLYAAPDAESLLSDEFVAGHCFRAVPGAGALVGLAFEPARGRGLTDVRGTLWVNRATSELDFLEYRYTGLPDQLPGGGQLGGRVSFQRLPTGSWIVSSWHIRRPQVVRQQVIGPGNTTRIRTSVTGLNDRGARVEPATDSLGRIVFASIRGRIHDSIAGRGLENAVVWVEGLPDSIVTDSAGRYELVVAAEGFRVVAARHPRIGLLGRPASQRVELTLGDTTAAHFSIPSPGAIGRVLCGTTWMSTGLAGIFFGADSAPAPGLDLRVTWRLPNGESRMEQARTGERGLFAICGDLPPHRSLELHVYEAKRRIMVVPLTLGGNFLWVELMVTARRGGGGRQEAKRQGGQEATWRM